MTSRDSIVWLPKDLYSSVEQLADPRFVWCPMPFDDSLPVAQTSFIDMGGYEEENTSRQAAAEVVPKHYDRNRDSGIDLSMDLDMQPSPPNKDVPDIPDIPDVPDERTDMSSSEAESDREGPFRKISQNISRGKRRQRKIQPRRHGHPKPKGAEAQGVRENRSFAVHLGLNLDVEVTLKARVYGGLELSML